MQERVRFRCGPVREQLPGFPTPEDIHRSPVHEEDLSRDVLRLVGAQGNDDRRAVGRIDRIEAVFGRRAHYGLRHPGARVGCEHICRHAVTPELLRYAEREADDARLRGAVVDMADVAEETRPTRGGDDAGVELFSCRRSLVPVGRRMPGRSEVSLEMHVYHRVPVMLLGVHEHAVAEVARVVDEDVETAERLDRLVDNSLRAGEIGDVLPVRDRLAAERLDLGRDLMRGAGIGALAADRRAEVVDDDARTGAR
jgi:hypothetical protein